MKKFSLFWCPPLSASALSHSLLWRRHWPHYRISFAHINNELFFKRPNTFRLFLHVYGILCEHDNVILTSEVAWSNCKTQFAEVESSRTSLASRTHFEVLNLEASSPRKLPCPRLEDSTIFEPLKFRWKTPETLRKICKDLFFDYLKNKSHEKKFLKTFFA